MNTIRPATEDDAALLSSIAAPSFMVSHGHSANETDIANYIASKLSPEAFAMELRDPANLFHIIHVDDHAAGYSKIILNAGHPEIKDKNISKLERLYMLQEYFGQSVGNELFQYLLTFSRQKSQSGMWLYVWTENHRAFSFYRKQGFEIIGSYNFQISPTHFNPNHVMYLTY